MVMLKFSMFVFHSILGHDSQVCRLRIWFPILLLSNDALCPSSLCVPSSTTISVLTSNQVSQLPVGGCDIKKYIMLAATLFCSMYDFVKYSHRSWAFLAAETETSLIELHSVTYDICPQDTVYDVGL